MTTLQSAKKSVNKKTNVRSFFLDSTASGRYDPNWGFRVQGSRFSAASGRERPVKSKKKLMNIEHPPAMHSALS
jgi:hypothetical protein